MKLATVVLVAALLSPVDHLIGEMQRNVDRIGCGHNAPFALLYLRTTEGIRDAIEAGEFSDRRAWNRVTVGFGRYYLDPLKAWRHGRHVTAAWRIAFTAARDKQVSTLGDVFLGINAHVNRDLAFIYHRFRVKNHADHLHVNDVLARVQPVAFPEIVGRYDPTLGQQAPNDPTLSLDIVAWRERAWRNARRLAAAPTRTARRRIAKRIERHAAAMARQIRAAFPTTSAAVQARDDYCAQHD